MNVNYTLNDIENVLALIRLSNPSVVIDATKVLIGVPVAGSFSGGRNTSILVQGIANKGFKGSQTFYYNRQPLSVAKKTGSFSTYMSVGSESLAVARNGICTQLELSPGEITWNSVSVPTNGGQVNFVLTAKANSLLYQPGSQITIPVIHATYATQVIMTAAETFNQYLGGIYWSRGHIGWSASNNLAQPTGSPGSGASITGGRSLMGVSMFKYIPEADSSDIWTPYFIIQVNTPTDPQPGNKGILKKLEIRLEDTVGRPIWLEKLIDETVGFTQGASGFSGGFPSRWAFARNGQQFTPGVRYRIKLFHL